MITMKMHGNSNLSDCIKWQTRRTLRKAKPEKSILSKLEKKLINVQKKYCLEKVCVRHGKWMKGRAYYVQNETMVLTVTNLPAISYLDLEEYSVNVNKHFPGERQLSDVFFEHRLKNGNDLDCQNFLWINKFSEMVQRYTERYRVYLRDSFLTEFVIRTASWLLQKWDKPRFEKLVKSLFKYKVRIVEFSLPFYSHILIKHCNDSSLIFDYFHKACLLCSSKSVLKILSNKKLNFYLNHTTNLLWSRPKWKGLEDFILDDLMLVENAFLSGNARALQNLLTYGWINYFTIYEMRKLFDFLPDNEKELITDCCEWPGKTLKPQSEKPFYYSKVGTLGLLYCYILLDNPPIDAKRNCIRLAWRSVPLPYISMDDILNLCTYLDTHVRGPGQEKISKFKAQILDAYPRDCLADHQPRSLMHLSRCKIRESVEFMAHIVTLPLPHHLKQYVRLKW